MHKRKLTDIDYALDLISVSYTSRCTPLGTDLDGRIYWALTPGFAEFEASRDLLAAGDEDTKKDGRRKTARRAQVSSVPNAGRRGEMVDWPFLLAVWGRPPAGVEVMRRVRGDGDDEAEVDYDNDEYWWGFWNPADVLKLAEWIAMTHNLDEDADQSTSRTQSSGKQKKGSTPARSSLLALVTSLREHSKLLEWRVRNVDLTAAVGKEAGVKQPGTVPPSRFYG
jgi:hypothetical protein